jgi:CIC family chloride channel protein
MSGALLKPSGEVIDRPRGGEARLWALALPVGVIVAAFVVFMGVLVAYGEFLFFGAAGRRMAARLADLPWIARFLPPVIGGVIVALILRLGVSWGWGPAPRPFGLSSLIAARRLRGPLRATTLALRDAMLSALASIVSLASGASAGREEPAAHLGASLAILHGRLLGLDRASRRLLLGMGAAAALAAALHAPLAAVFLVRELLLRGQRLASLGPVALAAGVAWITARWGMEAQPLLAPPPLASVQPGFLLLAPIAAAPLALALLVAIAVWTRAPDLVRQRAERWRYPVWALPAVGGVCLGLLALGFPQVLGIGYAPLAAGLGGGYSAALMLVLALAKTAATAVTAGFRFGGGPIAPVLFTGAMLGAAMGSAAALLTGEAASAQTFFGLLGMGLGLALLLDAPVAAALLVFELSRSPEAALAVLACALPAGLLARRLTPRPREDAAPPPLRWR